MNNNLIDKLLNLIDNMPQDIEHDKLVLILRIIYKETVKELCESLTEEQLNLYLDIEELKDVLDICYNTPIHQNYRDNTIRNISGILIEYCDKTINKNEYIQKLENWIKEDQIRAFL